MAENKNIHFVRSPEGELLREIESLIRKLAEGRADPSELQLLQDLQKLRIELMHPKDQKEREYA